MINPEKKSMLFYLDYRQHLELLSNADCGALVKALLCYAVGEKVPELRGAAAMAFSFMRAQLDRDNAQYEAQCERAREAGRKGGRPRKQRESDSGEELIAEPGSEEALEEKTEGFSEDHEEKSGFFPETSKSLKDTDTETETDKDTDTDHDKDADTDTETVTDTDAETETAADEKEHFYAAAAGGPGRPSRAAQASSSEQESASSSRTSPEGRASSGGAAARPGAEVSVWDSRMLEQSGILRQAIDGVTRKLEGREKQDPAAVEDYMKAELLSILKRGG